MFTYDAWWGDAGVRRFIRRIGRDALDSLFALREADNVGSGSSADAHELGELRAGWPTSWRARWSSNGRTWRSMATT